MGAQDIDLDNDFDFDVDAELSKLDDLSFGETEKPKNKREATLKVLKDAGSGAKDAFKFNKESLYDYIFIDIYRNEDDGLKLYLDFKKQDKENYHFWIENSFVVMLRRYLLDLMDLYNNEDNETINYLRKENEIYSYLDELTKNLEFNSFNAIKEFLSDSNIKELVSKK